MPLTLNQQEYIQKAIDHLFELPTDIKSLKLAVTKLQRAFKSEIKDEKDEPYFTLQQCIKKPEKYIHQVENQSTNVITVGEVKLHILEIANNKLKSVVKEFKLNAKNLSWDKEKIAAFLKKQPLFAKTFKSNKLNLDEWYNEDIAPPTESKKIFSTTFSIKDGIESSIITTVTVNLPPNLNITKTLEPIPLEDDLDSFSDDEDYEEYERDEIMPISVLAGRNAAEEIIMDYLVEQKIIPSKEILDKSAHILLTFSYYFFQIKNQKILISDLTGINSIMVDKLISPTMIELLESNQCDFKLAKQLPLELLENPFYYQHIKLNNIELKEITNLSNDQIKAFLSPNIQQLMNEKILNIDKIKKIPPDFLTLLKDDFYFEFFKKNPSFLTEELFSLNIEQIAKLLNDSMINLLGKEIITFEKALFIVKNQIIHHLLINGQLKIKDLDEILPSKQRISIDESEIKDQINEIIFSDAIIKEFVNLAENGLLFENDLYILYRSTELSQFVLEFPPENKLDRPFSLLNHPVMWNCCLANIYSRLKAMQEENPFLLHHSEKDSLDFLLAGINKFQLHTIDLWAEIFSYRLNQLLHKKTILIKEVKDNFAILQSSMLHLLKNHLNITYTEFLNKIFKNLLQIFMNQLKQVLSRDHSENLQDLFMNVSLIYIQGLKNDYNKSDPTAWITSFSSVLTLAQDVENKRITPKLFKPVDHHQEFCEKLCEFNKSFCELINKEVKVGYATII